MNKTESDQSPLTPGQILLNARKEQDISVETIAQGLRLDPLLIDALENDEYEQFPAMAYVRGYIRGYANQVGIDPAIIINSFDKKINEAPALEPFASRPEQQADSGDRHVRVVTYSLIGVLILLLGLWWQTQRSPPDKIVELVDELVNEEQSAAEVLDEVSAMLALPEYAEELTQEQQEGPKELEHDYAIVQLNEMPEAPEQDFSVVAQQPEEIVSEEQPTPVEETLSTIITPKPDLEPAAEKQINKSEGIVLEFTDDSWIEITDSTGKKRFSRLGKAGEIVDVAGQRPFKVIIGKSSVVKMSYQGTSIDLSSLAKNEVARFYIDKNGVHE